jgi:hypothetical protein
LIKLTTSDGLAIEISVKAAAHSELIKDAFGLGEDDENMEQDLVLDCPRLAFQTLESVVKYLEYYAETPMKAIPDPTTETVPPTLAEVVPQTWYLEFVVGLGVALMWRVRSAAHYLGIEPLTKLVNVWLAFHLMNKSLEEMNEILNMPKLMAAAQEAEAHKNNAQLPTILEKGL